MRKAFTLIELMVVTAVIAILLTVVVRIIGVGEDSSRRNRTVARLQRIENALSGYFAAFGSYPPVATHYSHNVYAKYDDVNDTENGETGTLEWGSVWRTCASQPVAARFPFSNNESVRKYLEMVSQEIASRANGDDSQFAEYQKYKDILGGGFKPLDSPNDLNGSDWESREKTWPSVKVFQFGLMSYLLPRYLFMTRCVGNKGDNSITYQELDKCGQWICNNRFSSHPNTGRQFGNWQQELEDKRLVRRIPSQAVCARWMPNFEGIVSGNPLTSESMRFYGIDTSDGTLDMDVNMSPAGWAKRIYVNQNRTVLDVLTVKDGWYNEFYYYSPPPYQSYRVWSAGADGKTFPPWIPLSTLKSDSDRKKAANWMADDIMYLNK